MAIIGGDVTEQITSKVDLFGSIMQQNVIENDLTREYGPLATIQLGMAIQFTVKIENDLYFDLNNSRLYVFAKITKANRMNIDSNTAAPINLTLHSMFRENEMQLNGQNGGYTSQLYPYRSVLKSLLNFCKEVEETCFLSERWTIDTNGNMNVTTVGGNNVGWKLAPGHSREIPWSSSLVVLTWTFLQKCFISPNINLHRKLISTPNDFLCKSAVPGEGAQQENYKLVIQSANLIIRTKQLTSTAHKALINLLVSQNMVHHLLRVQMKHLSISANQTSINFDNVCTGALPDIVVVGLVSDAVFAGGYQRTPFNFRNFGVDRIELTCNGTPRPIEGYTPNFANCQYITAYSTFLQELECDTGDNGVSLTPSEWANKYTLYAFKITDGPIEPGTYGPRFQSATGSARLAVSFAAAV